jgi:formylglycine-generating enzyme required for sulfatase activity
MLTFASTLVSCQNPRTGQNELILIPAGSFSMGEDSGRASNQPQHEVYLDAYFIQKTEVTRSQFLEFLAATGYQAIGWQTPDEEPRDLPATRLLWRDADAYCAWLGLRLPTEAEWEKAARGTDGRFYPWGNAWAPENANGADSGFDDVRIVGSYPQSASPYGLLDMSGNAAEWVSDYYDASYYNYSPTENPQGTTIVLDHVIRGGSYASPAEQLMTFFRNSSHSVCQIRV